MRYWGLRGAGEQKTGKKCQLERQGARYQGKKKIWLQKRAIKRTGQNNRYR
jgi:hypothetical protein